MDFVTTVNIPTPPSTNLGFYEHTTPICVLSSDSKSQTAEIPLGSYDNLAWEAGASDEKLNEAESWGTKTLPGAGAFYFANHEDGTTTIGHLNSR